MNMTSDVLVAINAINDIIKIHDDALKESLGQTKKILEYKEEYKKATNKRRSEIIREILLLSVKEFNVRPSVTTIAALADSQTYLMILNKQAIDNKK